MDIVSGASVAWKILKFFFTEDEEFKERKHATTYLTEKYALTPVEQVHYGLSSSYAPGEERYICGETWEKAVVDILQQISTSSTVTAEVMETCGDLALFMIVLEGKYRDRITSDEWWEDQEKGRKWAVLSRHSETFKSLYELSRGRGNDLALGLIQSELKDWLNQPASRFIRDAFDAAR